LPHGHDLRIAKSGTTRTSAALRDRSGRSASEIGVEAGSSRRGELLVSDRAGGSEREADDGRPVVQAQREVAGGGGDGFRFGYSDLVGIIQGLSNGKHISASFVLQDLPSMRDEVEEAPPLVDPKGQPTAQSAQPSILDK